MYNYYSDILCVKTEWRNSFLIYLPPLSGQKFLSLNTWITKHDRKDYEERQVGGLQKGRLQSAIGFG